MMHNQSMRTSVTLDEDVYDFVWAYSTAKGITLGAAIGELVHKAENAPEPVAGSPRLKPSPHGYLVIAATGKKLTPEMVKDASEDEVA
jgi:hypothetical protein